MTSPAPPHIACSACSLRDLCMPPGLPEDEMRKLDTLVTAQRRVPRGAVLFRNGDRFDTLFAVRNGHFKTSVTAQDGREQVTGFHIAGEIIGLEGIVADQHRCDAVALEDSDVCVLPFSRVADLSRTFGPLQDHLHRVMSGEIVREHKVMLLLGSTRAEERVAAFLINLLQRMEARGYSGTELVLRMTRRDIGSYLGLKLETVSRTFTRFVHEGLIEVQHRHVRVLDARRLRALMPQHDHL